ncbi:MAG: efflux transporter outer membrane subunit [Magnetococcales bacterium]|nr:efflux transporter outer membrane subunit [Magnetococcales bacterium]
MRRSFLLAVGVTLAGCAQIPEYQQPEAPIPDHWSQTNPSATPRRAERTGWRQFFPDPRLQSLIETALAHNRDLAVAAGRLKEARALHGLASAERLPNVKASATEATQHTPADLSSSGAQSTSSRYDVGFSLLSFELDFWGRVKALNDAARAHYLASEEAWRAFSLSLVAEVANAYFTLLEMEEQSQLALATLHSREEVRTMIDRRRGVGLAADLDFLAADGACQTARVEYDRLQQQRAVAQHALELLAGWEPEHLPQGRSLADQGVVPDFATGVASEVLLQRPDVLAAEQRLLAANANIGAARAAFLPGISLTTGLGTASKELSGLFALGSGSWTFQPSLSLPLFDAGRAQAGVDLAEARKIIAVAEYEKTIQQAFREVADLLAAREHVAEQIRAQEAVVTSQRQRLRLADARYQAGLSSYLEVLDAQRDVYTAERSTVQTRRAWLTAAAQLYKALGGGMTP